MLAKDLGVLAGQAARSGLTARSAIQSAPGVVVGGAARCSAAARRCMVVLLAITFVALGFVGAGRAEAEGCKVALQRQASSTKCTGGPYGRFGCFSNDSRWMWAGEGCRGVFLCNGHGNVSCGDGFGKKAACPCAAGPLPPPPPFPPPPPPPPIPPAPPAPSGPLCNING